MVLEELRKNGGWRRSLPGPPGPCLHRPWDLPFRSPAAPVTRGAVVPAELC